MMRLLPELLRQKIPEVFFRLYLRVVKIYSPYCIENGPDRGTSANFLPPSPHNCRSNLTQVIDVTLLQG